MSRYLDIRSLQDPFDIGTDNNDRTMWSCNYEGTAAGLITQLEEEIYRFLYDNGLVTGLNVDVMIGPRTPPVVPNVAAHINILNTGGSQPSETHNGDKYANFSFQIIVRSVSYVTGRTKAQAIRAALDGQRNITITAA